MSIKNEKLTMRVIVLLERHIRKDISINDFRELTTVLDLSAMNKKLIKGIIEEHRKNQAIYESNTEFDLLEAMDSDE